jgi:hypothetical protein
MVLFYYRFMMNRRTQMGVLPMTLALTLRQSTNLEFEPDHAALPYGYWCAKAEGLPEDTSLYLVFSTGGVQSLSRPFGTVSTHVPVPVDEASGIPEQWLLVAGTTANTANRDFSKLLEGIECLYLVVAGSPGPASTLSFDWSAVIVTIKRVYGDESFTFPALAVTSEPTRATCVAQIQRFTEPDGDPEWYAYAGSGPVVPAALVTSINGVE